MPLASAKQNVLDTIDAATAPRHMGATEALSLLDELQDDIQVRIDALKEDIYGPTPAPAPHEPADRGSDEGSQSGEG